MNDPDQFLEAGANLQTLLICCNLPAAVLQAEAAWPSKQGSGFAVMKNWLPAVSDLGWSRSPRYVYCFAAPLFGPVSASPFAKMQG